MRSYEVPLSWIGEIGTFGWTLSRQFRGKYRAGLQPIAVLREGRRVPDRVVGRKSYEPSGTKRL